jgi:hypothetical protein
MTKPPSSHAIELHWQPGQSLVSWTYGDARASMQYQQSPLTVTAWPDPPSVIVVEAQQQPHPRTDNAVVFDPDGTERLRLQPPDVSPEPSWDIGFDQVYADASGLVAVFATRTGDFWGRPDLDTGELMNIAQWR